MCRADFATRIISRFERQQQAFGQVMSPTDLELFYHHFGDIWDAQQVSCCHATLALCNLIHPEYVGTCEVRCMSFTIDRRYLPIGRVRPVVHHTFNRIGDANSVRKKI
jgi:hypothetical protein